MPLFSTASASLPSLPHFSMVTLPQGQGSSSSTAPLTGRRPLTPLMLPCQSTLSFSGTVIVPVVSAVAVKGPFALVPFSKLPLPLQGPVIVAPAGAALATTNADAAAIRTATSAALAEARFHRVDVDRRNMAALP